MPTWQQLFSCSVCLHLQQRISLDRAELHYPPYFLEGTTASCGELKLGVYYALLRGEIHGRILEFSCFEFVEAIHLIDERRI
jgi:hypothetical protein